MINNLGSTALARSLRYPIILRNNKQYIIDFLQEPMYHYYRPLNQPLILSSQDKAKVKSTQSQFNLKYDGIKGKIHANEISLEQKKSKAKVLNIESMNFFIEKAQKLF